MERLLNRPGRRLTAGTIHGPLHELDLGQEVVAAVETPRRLARVRAQLRKVRKAIALWALPPDSLALALGAMAAGVARVAWGPPLVGDDQNRLLKVITRRNCRGVRLPTPHPPLQPGRATTPSRSAGAASLPLFAVRREVPWRIRDDEVKWSGRK